jgi:hypothetical protein
MLVDVVMSIFMLNELPLGATLRQRRMRSRAEATGTCRQSETQYLIK